MGILLKLITSLAVISAIGVVSVSNPIHSILCLILVFGLTGISLIIMGVEFIGLLYILVYVGAIAVLFLFVIMCLNIKSERLLDKLNYFPLVFAGLILFTNFFTLELKTSTFILPSSFGQYSFKAWEQLLSSVTDIEIIGQYLFFFYPLPVILIGFILLVAMVGAIFLTLSTTNTIRRQNVYTKANVSYDNIIREIN